MELDPKGKLAARRAYETEMSKRVAWHADGGPDDTPMDCAIHAYLSALPASKAGWRGMPAPSLERVVVAGWQPARQTTQGYWWYHEDCTDNAGKPIDHPKATLWLPLSDLLPAFPAAPDRRATA